MPLTDHWRLLMGLTIIAIVLVSPHGLVGGLERLGAFFARQRLPAREAVRP
jgi:ABC-type branched-subunit amino acid transport system permease subunit